MAEAPRWGLPGTRLHSLLPEASPVPAAASRGATAQENASGVRCPPARSPDPLCASPATPRTAAEVAKLHSSFVQCLLCARCCINHPSPSHSRHNPPGESPFFPI